MKSFDILGNVVFQEEVKLDFVPSVKYDGGAVSA